MKLQATVRDFWALGLDVCICCCYPFCRECGGHTERVKANLRPGWREGGWTCECGWALTDPLGIVSA